MRGSGVVQSLKSLASKLHPQLPLSPKESQRLLTALTSSFRQKLDEAHPRQAHDEHAEPKVATGSSLKTGNHALHTSSVAFADRHLASVLTNPLLAKSDGAKKPTLDLDSAKRELEQNPERDPISLLEDYHQRGAATIPIAYLCLKTFRASLLSLSADDRRTKVEKHRAGRRTIHWLWTSELFHTDEFVDDRRLMTVLVNMMLEEGLEHYLWSWLEMDMTLGKQDRHRPQGPGKPPGKPVPGSRVYRYRWKDFLARCLIMRRWDDQNPATLNDVLDTYFKAVDLHLQLTQASTTNCLPLSMVINTINNRIFTSRRAKTQWDVKRYDRYIETIDLLALSPIRSWDKYYKALLRLTHPRDPSPLPILESLKTSFLAEPKSRERSIWNYFGKEIARLETRSKAKLRRYILLAETARQLQDQGYTADSDWLVSQIRDLYPEFVQYLDNDLTTGGKPPKLRPTMNENFGEMHRAVASFTGARAT
jgi:hypothetical protein